MEALDQQPTSDQLQQRLQTLTRDNLNLHEKNEHLERRLGQLAGSTRDLSCRLVRAEEDRLQISKELVEEKMQTNKMREQYEEETFQLKNKVLNRDAAIADLERERDELLGELQAAQAGLKAKEKNDGELAEELATLKRDYLLLEGQSQTGGRLQNQQLSTELLALARAQGQLDQQQHSLQGLQSSMQGLQGQLDQQQQSLQGLQSSMQGLQSPIQGLQSSMQGLQGQLDQQQQSLQGLQSSMQGLQSSMQSLQSSMQGLQGQLDQQQHSLQGLQSSMQGLQSPIQGLQSSMQSLQSSMQGLQGQLDQQQQSLQSSMQGLQGQLDPVQALISHMAHHRVQTEDPAASDKKQKTMEEPPRGNRDEIRDVLERMRSSYEEQRTKLEEKVVAMGREQQENARLIHEGRRRLSAQTAALMCSQSQAKEAERENSELQLQVKELNEEFRARLVCYLQDLSKYVDGLGKSKVASDQRRLETFVDDMLRDVRRSYRLREEQLAAAARRYKRRLQEVAGTHRALVVAYRVQRDQILANPDGGLSPGPPEAQFSLEPGELREEAELQSPRQDKAGLEARLQRTVSETPAQKTSCHGACGHVAGRDVLRSKRVDAERERALLLTRAAVAEAEVLELQGYVDHHLARYKEEVALLRRLHETAAAARRSHSAHS